MHRSQPRATAYETGRGLAVIAVAAVVAAVLSLLLFPLVAGAGIVTTDAEASATTVSATASSTPSRLGPVALPTSRSRLGTVVRHTTSHPRLGSVVRHTGDSARSTATVTS